MSWKKYEQLANYPWEILTGRIAPEVLSAPKTGGDLSGGWLPVHERIVRYLLRHVVGQPWKDHLTLIAAVLSARNRDVSTVELIVQSLQVRFSRLLPALGLKAMDEWNADLHIPKYLKGEVLPEESSHMRFSFLRHYSSATKQVWYWFNTLPEAEQHVPKPISALIDFSTSVKRISRHLHRSFQIIPTSLSTFVTKKAIRPLSACISVCGIEPVLSWLQNEQTDTVGPCEIKPREECLPMSRTAMGSS